VLLVLLVALGSTRRPLTTDTLAGIICGAFAGGTVAAALGLLAGWLIDTLIHVVRVASAEPEGPPRRRRRRGRDFDDEDEE
jgi:hypothetical protein